MDINKLKRKALSGEDILKLIDYKSNIMKYKELYKYKNIYEALGPYKAIILLYENKPSYGHWCCVFEQNKNTISFFDPYGLLIDDEINYIPKEFKNINGTKFPILRKLLYNSKYKYIDYNNHRLQELKDGISTCGRHVACRLLFRHLDTNQYYNYLKSFNMNIDDLVTILTSSIK